MLDGVQRTAVRTTAVAQDERRCGKPALNCGSPVFRAPVQYPQATSRYPMTTQDQKGDAALEIQSRPGGGGGACYRPLFRRHGKARPARSKSSTLLSRLAAA